MQRSIKNCFALALINQAVEASKLKAFTKEEDTCSDDGWTHIDANLTTYRTDGETIENTIFTCEPNIDVCVKVVGDNVTFRNVIIYHPANGMGLYGWKPNNLTLENVEIIAYGNEWGAAPCPTRSPLKGYRCVGMELSYAENLHINNVLTDGGSKGISIRFSDNALIENVVARNVRGPFPAGQCFQIHTSHGTVVENFHCYNDPKVAWTEDAISVYHSADVTLRHGVVNGGNSSTGQSVMYEGSSEESIGGYVDDVEVVNAQGCFGYYPQKDVFQTGGICASPVCASDNPPRGAQPMTNLWTAGANLTVNLYAEDIWVEDSYVYDVCDESEMRINWEWEEGLYTNFEVTELDEFTPREPPSVNLPWDSDCWRPTLTCADFWQEHIGGEQESRVSTTNADKSTYENLQGSCYGNLEWNDGLDSQDPVERAALAAAAAEE